MRSGKNHKQNKLIIELDENGKTINTFNGVNLASRETGISAACISRCCNNKTPKANGRIFRFKET
jgi:hypothetical protein